MTNSWAPNLIFEKLKPVSSHFVCGASSIRGRTQLLQMFTSKRYPHWRLFTKLYVHGRFGVDESHARVS